MKWTFEILGTKFSQSLARAACSDILNKYKRNQIVEGGDFLFLKDAFEKHHYNPSSKLPTPIKAIKVNKSDNGKNNEFSITLEDGTETHIGYSSKCFVSPTIARKIIYKDNAVDAARNEIRPQQDSARIAYREYPSIYCGICHQEIKDTSDIDVDHTPPNEFKEILKKWLRSRGQKLEEIGYIDELNSSVRKFKDKAEAEDWISYHHSLFNPRPTHASCNRGQGK